MSESNGKQSYSNRVLYEAYVALVELGNGADEVELRAALVELMYAA